MHTRCRGAYVAAAFLVAARITPVVMVDDSDPGIEYRGTIPKAAIISTTGAR